MHKAPYRPNNDISQPFNDGYVDIFSVNDIAKPGYQPKLSLTPKHHLFYAEQRLGINRLYMSRQNQVEINRVIRIPRVEGITNQDIAVHYDGKRYKIDSVQSVPGVSPPSLDVALVLIEQNPEEGEDLCEMV